MAKLTHAICAGLPPMLLSDSLLYVSF